MNEDLRVALVTNNLAIKDIPSRSPNRRLWRKASCSTRPCAATCASPIRALPCCHSIPAAAKTVHWATRSRKSSSCHRRTGGQRAYRPSAPTLPTTSSALRTTTASTACWPCITTRASRPSRPLPPKRAYASRPVCLSCAQLLPTAFISSWPDKNKTDASSMRHAIYLAIDALPQSGQLRRAAAEPAAQALSREARRQRNASSEGAADASAFCPCRCPKGASETTQDSAK